jgi:uncharacterized protein
MVESRVHTGNNGKPKLPPVVSIYSELLNRMNLAIRMGEQYGGDRDIYEALGYKTELDFDDYYSRYIRQDIAKAIIDRPVKASWKGKLTIIENNKEKETNFEKEWKKLYEDMKFKSIFMRADKLTGLGRYSIILFGLNDVKSIDDWAKPSRSRGDKRKRLLYLKPLSEENAKILEFENNPSNKRFGLPKYYSVFIGTQTTGGQTVERSIKVHYSRVLHIVEDILESEVYGTPRLQAVYNRLMDLEKLVGGDAEMFWRGARPGYVGKLDPEYEISDTGMKELQEQVDEFEHNLRRILINKGVDYTSLQQQIADPSKHVDVQFQLISAVTAIPKRILTGSERGELSSAQDKQEYISYVAARREEQNEPMILRPFVDKLIELGVLSKPKDGKFIVVWDKAFSMSDAEKVNMGKVRSIALKEYSVNPYAQELMPFEYFLEYLLGLDESQIEQIIEGQGDPIIKERPLSDEEAKLLKTRSGRDYRTSTGESFDIDEY